MARPEWRSKDMAATIIARCPSRPVYDWPGGKRLAVYLGLNLETFAFGEGLGAKLAPALGEPDVLNFAWRDYGNRVGAWRLRELFENAGLPASRARQFGALRRGARADRGVFAPRRRDRRRTAAPTPSARARLSEAEERALIAEATRAHRARPRARRRAGWLGPWISESAVTPDLLAEAGYRYVLDWAMDDQPIFLRTRGGGRLLAVPYPQELNDIPADRRAPGERRGIRRHDRRRLRRNARAVAAGAAGDGHRAARLYRRPAASAAPAAARAAPYRAPGATTSGSRQPGAIADHCYVLPAGMIPG